MIESLILPPPYSLLNEYLIKSTHLVICEDLIRIFLEDSPKSNQASLSDWMVTVGQGNDVIRKAYKNLRHQRRGAEVSFSGVTAWDLSEHTVNHSRAGKLQTSAKDPSSYLWSAGFHWWHAAAVSGRFLYFQVYTP